MSTTEIDVLPPAAELSEIVLSGVPLEQQTLGVNMLCFSLADAYLRALEERRPLDLVHWFTQNRAGADGVDVVDLARNACASLSEYLSAQRAGDVCLGPLHALSSSLVAPPRVPKETGSEYLAPTKVDAAVNDVVRRLDRHDPCSGDEARCVADWCTRLARRLGFTPADVLFARHCGLVHDLGMLSIPGDVLHVERFHNGQITEATRAHALLGERLARENPLLAPFADIVRWHHERIDGLGFPDGLRGEEIPLVARLVAVADAFATLVGRHGTRPPSLAPAAVVTLEAESGTRFDTTIVTAMRRIVGV